MNEWLINTTFILILAVAGIVFAFLQIILFFKLWRMTNDVRTIKNKVAGYEETNSYPTDIKIGDFVCRTSDEKQMVVKDIRNGTYICYSTTGAFEGNYTYNELRKVGFKIL